LILFMLFIFRHWFLSLLIILLDSIIADTLIFHIIDYDISMPLPLMHFAFVAAIILFRWRHCCHATPCQRHYFRHDAITLSFCAILFFFFFSVISSIILIIISCWYFDCHWYYSLLFHYCRHYYYSPLFRMLAAIDISLFDIIDASIISLLFHWLLPLFAFISYFDILLLLMLSLPLLFFDAFFFLFYWYWLIIDIFDYAIIAIID
jgi:hypothetical protein